MLLLTGSIGISALLWIAGFPFFFMFLFIPLIPFIGRHEVKQCPICGFQTCGNEIYCPYDGVILKETKK